MFKRQRELACDCDDCEEFRGQDSVTREELAFLEAHSMEASNKALSSRNSIEFPRSMIIFGLVALIIMLGFFTWQGNNPMIGSVLGFSLLVNGWVMGTGFTQSQERAHQERLRFQVGELEKRLGSQSLHSDFASMRYVNLELASQRVVAQAKVRRSDLDGDDEDFMYEVPSRAMMDLSDVVTELGERE